MKYVYIYISLFFYLICSMPKESRVQFLFIVVSYDRHPQCGSPLTLSQLLHHAAVRFSAFFLHLSMTASSLPLRLHRDVISRRTAVLRFALGGTSSCRSRPHAPAGDLASRQRVYTCNIHTYVSLLRKGTHVFTMCNRRTQCAFGK